MGEGKRSSLAARDTPSAYWSTGGSGRWERQPAILPPSAHTQSVHVDPLPRVRVHKARHAAPRVRGCGALCPLPCPRLCAGCIAACRGGTRPRRGQAAVEPNADPLPPAPPRIARHTAVQPLPLLGNALAVAEAGSVVGDGMPLGARHGDPRLRLHPLLTLLQGAMHRLPRRTAGRKAALGHHFDHLVVLEEIGHLKQLRCVTPLARPVRTVDPRTGC